MTDLIPADQSPSETRQTARLDGIPDLYRQKHERLAIELALNMDDAEAIFRAYDYPPEQAALLVESPAFVLLLERVTKDLRENGVTFKAKIKALAEEWLPYAHDIVTDPLAPTSERGKLIQWAAKLAGHEPKEKDEAKGAGSGLTLSITFSGQAPQQVVSSHDPITIEQEN
jgi:hypothetical protein